MLLTVRTKFYINHLSIVEKKIPYSFFTTLCERIKKVSDPEHVFLLSNLGVLATNYMQSETYKGKKTCLMDV